MIEFVYDNLLKEYVVYDNCADDVVFVGEFLDCVNEYMLALFGVESLEGVGDGRS